MDYCATKPSTSRSRCRCRAIGSLPFSRGPCKAPTACGWRSAMTRTVAKSSRSELVSVAGSCNRPGGRLLLTSHGGGPRRAFRHRHGPGKERRGKQRQRVTRGGKACVEGHAGRHPWTMNVLGALRHRISGGGQIPRSSRRCQSYRCPSSHAAGKRWSSGL